MKTKRKRLKWVDRGAFASDWGCIYQVITTEKPNLFRVIMCGIHGSIETILDNSTKRAAIQACEKHAREKGPK